MSAPAAAKLHGTCMALGEIGVLLMGPSGSGKSDLALRLIADGWELVADDQVVIERRGGRLVASAPKALADLLEVRGLGIVEFRSRAQARLALVVELTRAQDIERMPEPETHEVLGVTLPLCRIDAQAASAPQRLLAALSRLVR